MNEHGPSSTDFKVSILAQINHQNDKLSTLQERIARTEQKDIEQDSRLDRHEQLIIRNQEDLKVQYRELLEAVKNLSLEASQRQGAEDQKETQSSLLWRRIGVIVSILALAGSLGWLSNEAQGGKKDPDKICPPPRPPLAAEQPFIPPKHIHKLKEVKPNDDSK